MRVREVPHQDDVARIRFQNEEAKAAIWLYFKIKPSAKMASVGSPAGFVLNNPFLY